MDYDQLDELYLISSIEAKISAPRGGHRPFFSEDELAVILRAVARLRDALEKEE